MGALDLKNSVIASLDNADDTLLKPIKLVIEKYLENETVAYSTVGEPLNKSNYEKLIEEAILEIEQGNYLSQDELEQESENWS